MAERYAARGVCANAIEYELDENNVVTHLNIVGGCVGNTQGLCKLCVGRRAEDVIATLAGINCRRGTSCPDQVAKALAQKIGK